MYRKATIHEGRPHKNHKNKNNKKRKHFEYGHRNHLRLRKYLPKAHDNVYALVWGVTLIPYPFKALELGK